MDFKTKIDKLLKVKKLPLWKLAEEAGLDSTLRKAYADNREMRDTTTWKFLESLGISEGWWQTGQGDIFVNGKTVVQFDGSYEVPEGPPVPPSGPQGEWVPRAVCEALEARLKEAQARIDELLRQQAQHNEVMKQVVALATQLAQKGGHLPDDDSIKGHTF